MQQIVLRIFYLQLDCPPDGHWDYADIFAVEVQFQIRDQFWIPQPKLHGTAYILDFFAKPQNGHFAFFASVFSGVFKWFPGVFRHYIGDLSSNRCFSELGTHYERNLVR